MEDKELSEFMKLAYMKNKVKDIEDVFEEYKPEEEWHQGKIENLLFERTE